jgi:copper(I)-binding protein
LICRTRPSGSSFRLAAGRWPLVLFALLLGLVLHLPPASASDAAGIEVRDAWIRLPPPKSHAAGYLTLVNGSGGARTLVAARSDRAERVEIHRSEMREGVARMVPVESVTLPAEGALVFEPRGLHLMLMHPKALSVGERVPLELVFEEGDPLRLEAEVRRAAPTGHGDHEHGDHGAPGDQGDREAPGDHGDHEADGDHGGRETHEGQGAHGGPTGEHHEGHH